MHIQAIIRFLVIGFGAVSGFVNQKSPSTAIRPSYQSQICTATRRPIFLHKDVKFKAKSMLSVSGPQKLTFLSATNTPAPEASRTLIAFTGFGDLRVDDNEALQAALNSEDCSAAFIFDPLVLSRMSDRRVKLLYAAVADLHSSLTKSGIRMTVRIGTFANEISKLSYESGVTDIFVHDDPVHEVSLILQ
jgi:hypothetical protein